MTGKKFGKYTVEGRAPDSTKDSSARWFCRCTCGTLTTVSGSSLRKGDSHGCLTCARGHRTLKNRVGVEQPYEKTSCSKCKIGLRVAGSSWCNSCIWSAAKERQAKQPALREKSLKRARDFYRTRPDKRLEYRLKIYGITVEQYKAALEAQNHSCAICKRKESGSAKRDWNIDHDHVTKKFRGILCPKCNIALAHFRDNPAIIFAAFMYILKNKGDTPCVS